MHGKKHRFLLFFLVIVWLATAWYARREFLPYDVKNTDVGTVLFQAQTFASGKLWRDTPEPRNFFQQWQAVVRDRSYAYYPPVHALFIAIPVCLGLDPWLMPWFLSGASLILLYIWASRISCQTTALFAAGSMAFSPFFAANIPSLVSHSSCLFLTLLFLWLIVRWREEGKMNFAFFSGLAWGLVFADRMLNAVALGLVWLPWVLWSRKKMLKNEVNALLAFGIGGLLVLMSLLFYNHALSGKWTFELFTDYWPRNKYGFGENLGRGEPGHYFQTFTTHDWTGFFRNLNYSFQSLAEWWTGNKILSVLLALIVLGMILYRVVVTEKDSSRFVNFKFLPIFIWLFLHTLFYAFYFTPSKPDTGPRYLSEIIPALAVVSGWVLSFLFSLKKIGRWLCTIVGLAFVLITTHQTTAFYQDNLRMVPMQRQLEKTVLEGAKPPALVFIRSFWLGHPFPIFLNRPNLEGPILYACDRGAEDRLLVDRHLHRNAYILAVEPSKEVKMELVQIYEAATQKWLMAPEKVKARFYVGSYFTGAIELEGEVARVLFHPREEDVPNQHMETTVPQKKKS